MEELLSRHLTFTVSAPQGDLSGLTRTLDLLKSIQQVLNAVNGGFRGFAPDRLATRSQDQFRGQIQGISDPQGNPIKNVIRNLTADQIIDRLFGGTGLSTFQAQFAALGREFPKAFQGKLFTSIEAASQVSGRLQAIIQEQESRNAQQLASIFKGSRVNAQVPITPPQAPAPPAPPKEVAPTPVLAAGNLFLTVPPERITVRLGNGNVELIIPTERITPIQPLAAAPVKPSAVPELKPEAPPATPSPTGKTPAIDTKKLEKFIEEIEESLVGMEEAPKLRSLTKRAKDRGYITEAQSKEVQRIQKDVGSAEDTQDAMEELQSYVNAFAKKQKAAIQVPPTNPEPTKPQSQTAPEPANQKPQVSEQGSAKLEVPPSRIDAQLGAGQVKLEVPADRIDAATTQPAASPVQAATPAKPAPPPPPQKKALKDMSEDELVAWVMSAEKRQQEGMREGKVRKMLASRTPEGWSGNEPTTSFLRKLHAAQDDRTNAEKTRPVSATPPTPSPASPQPAKPAVKPGELPLTEGDKAKPGAGKVDLEIPVVRVDAKLGLGQVKLDVPVDRIDAKAGAIPPAQGGPPGAPIPGGGAAPPNPPKPPVAASAAPAGDSGGSGGGNVFLTPDGLAEPIDPEAQANEVRRRLLQTRKTASTQITEITKGLDKVTNTLALDKTGAVVLDRRVTEVNPVAKLRNELKRGIADATKEANDSVTAGLSGGRVSDLRARAQSFRVLSDRLNALAEFSRESAENLGQQAQIAQLSKAAAQASRQARQLAVRADNEEAQLRRQAQQQADRAVQQRLQQMARTERQVAAEEAADRKIVEDRAKLIDQSGQRSRRTQQQNRRIADEESRQEQRMQGAQIAVGEARRQIGELRAPDSGFRQTRQTTDSGFRIGSNFYQQETVRFEAERGDQTLTRSIQILRRNGQEVAASIQETTREITEVQRFRKRLAREVSEAVRRSEAEITASLTSNPVTNARQRTQILQRLSGNLASIARNNAGRGQELGETAIIERIWRTEQRAARQAREAMAQANRSEEAQRSGQAQQDQRARQQQAQRTERAAAQSDRTRRQNQRIRDRETRQGQMLQGAQITIDEAANRAAQMRLPDSGWREMRSRRSEGFRRGANFFETERVEFQRDEGNQRVTQAFNILYRNGQAAAATMERTTRALRATREEMAAAGREFFRNLSHVTAWTVSVGALYGALGLARAGMQSFLNSQYQVARLTVVFGDGTKAARREASGLANDLMMLAAANGRNVEEALQAGIAWSRLGLTRRQVSEAVRVSLLAANVAEIDAAAATENLQAIYQSYGLSVRELGGLLGQLNQISNTSNASVGELFTGLSRVASIAAQANIPLEVLNGLLGQTISQTKQSGANIGNALKTIVGRISSPDILKSLQGNFGVEIADAMGQQKPTLDILDALFVRYQQLANAERQALLVQLAGNTQLTRAAALLDNYIRAQVLAINTQNSLNSAEAENQVIRETLISQLRGIGAELERFAFLQGSNGPVAGLNLLARTFRNVVALFNAPGFNMAVTGTIGFLGAVIARAAIARARVDDVSNSNFLSRSATRARQIAAVTTEESAGLLRDIGFYLDPRTLPERGRLARRRINRGFEDIRIGAAFLGPSLAGGNLRDVADSTRMIASGAIKSTLGAATAILGKWPVFAAGAAAATVAFNTTLEQLGITMNGTEEAINRTSAALQAFAQQEKSAGNTVRVLRLAAESISKAADPKRVSDILNAISQIPGALSQAQLDSLRQNPADAANIIRPAIEAQTLRQDEARANALIVSTYALRRAEADLANTRDSGVFSSDQKRITLQAEAARQRENLLRMAEEEVRGQSEDPRMAEAQQERARRVNAVLDARLRILNEIVSTSAGDDTISKLNAQITAQEAFNQGLRQQLETQRIANRESQAAADQANQRYEQENRKLAALTDAADAIGIPARLVSSALNGQISTTDKLRAGFGSDTAERFGNVRPLSQESLKILGELAPQLIMDGTPNGLVSPYIAAPVIMELSREQAKTTAMAQRQARQISGRSNTDATIDNRLVQSEKDVEDLRRQRDLALRQATIERTQRDTKRDIGGAAFGDNETEKIQRQIRAAQREYEDAQERLDRSNLTERDQIEQTARASAAVLEIKRLQEDQSRRQVDIEREINQLIIDRTREFQKQILTQSPTELLRTLAALQTASRGLNAGRFFAAGDLRDRILEIPGLGTDEARLARERAQARRTRERPREQIDSLLEALQSRLTQILAPIVAQPVNVGPNAAAAAGAVGALATAADLAGTAANALSSKLGALSTAVDALAAKMNGIAIPPNLPIPRGVPGR